MPGTLIKRNILNDFTVTTNQAMSGDAQMNDPGKKRMSVRIQRTGKQRIDPRSAKFAGRQADIVDHEQRRRFTIRAAIKVRRRYAPRIRQPALI
jgi:hypothetical protein